MSITINVLLGVIGSVLATALLYLLSYLYTPRYKEQFYFSLDTAINSLYQIENLKGFPNDYPTVISQVDILRQSAFEMYRCLTPLSLWIHPKRKKMIITLLYDIIRVCEISKFTTVGFSGEDEWESRLKKIETYFYKYSPLYDENCSTVSVQLSIIENLINGNDIKTSIRKAFNNLYDELPLEDLATDGFIEINSFRSSSNNKIQKHCFSKIELERVLRKEFTI